MSEFLTGVGALCLVAGGVVALFLLLMLLCVLYGDWLNEKCEEFCVWMLSKGMEIKDWKSRREFHERNKRKDLRYGSD